MTMIMGMLCSKEEKSDEKALVMATDSMASDPERFGKNDTIQKLFRVGDNIVLRAGSAHLSAHAIQSLQEMGNLSPSQAAEHLIHSTEKMYKQSPWPLQNSCIYLVGGMGSDLELYNVNTVFMHPENTRPGAPITPTSFEVAGSAQEPIQAYMQGSHDAGKNLGYGLQSVADALTLAHDFGQKGARNLGVNDKLQFGIITHDTGISRLYHPQVNLDSRTGYEYM
ncbi:MAG: hypothetical protein ACOCWQ_04755, partial [Nanoarchaeota archaeon]